MFQNKKKPSYTVIIGCGRLGANLAETLSDGGKDKLILAGTPTLIVEMIGMILGRLEIFIVLIGFCSSVKVMKERFVRR